MIVKCDSLNFSYLDEGLLKDINFHIEDNDKLALMGNNGSGKTTLLRLIKGSLSPLSGSITFKSQAKVAYLPQTINFNSNKSLYDELYLSNLEIISLENKIKEKLSQLEDKNLANVGHKQLAKEYSLLLNKFELLDGYSYKSRVQGVLNGLGFPNQIFKNPVNSLSLGQKTSLYLGKLLLDNYDLLLLDEPTNHLDIHAIEWLENYLISYKKAILIVSHDRYFVDKVCNKIMDLDNSKIKVYKGSYSYFISEKEKNLESDIKKYENQQKEIKRQEEIITKLRSYSMEKFIKRAKSREKALGKMQVLDRPSTFNRHIKLKLEPSISSGNDVLKIEGLYKSFSNLHLFEDSKLDIKKGERVALIGDNGSGKTTLFKMIMGKIKPDRGKIIRGTNVYLGYYEQGHENLNPEKTLIEEINDRFPNMGYASIRKLLAGFLFVGDDVFKKIKNLSGGEKARLSLAIMMTLEANFLLLDEPTNHLDYMSREVLEKALKNYSGTLLMISHDRYFLSKVATRIVELNEKKLKSYIGDYEYYKQQKQRLAKDDEELEFIGKSSGKKDWQKQKEDDAKKRKLQNSKNTLIKTIQLTEDEIKTIDLELAKESVYTDFKKAQDLSEKKDKLENQLLSYYEKLDKILGDLS